MKPRVLLNSNHVNITLQRLAHQLIENHGDFSSTVLVGMQTRGVLLARRLKSEIENILNESIQYGELDITFHRDDFRRGGEPITASATQMDFLIENKRVILIDDVLYTGRSIRAGLDAIQAFGRPSTIELLTLIDRRLSRHVPIQPDYVGKVVDSVASERVKVEWADEGTKDQVLLFNEEVNE